MKMLGFGQVLWDLTVETDFSFLQDSKFEIGGHHLVDKKSLYAMVHSTWKY